MNARRADASTTSDGQTGAGWQITGRHVLIALVLFFGMVMVVNVFMIRAAVSTFGGVETRSSYRAGLGFSDEQQRVADQDARGWTVNADVTGTSDERTIRVEVRDRGDALIGGLIPQAAFAHPVDSRLDVSLDLVETGIGIYTANFALPAGAWVLKMNFERDGETIFRSQNRHVLR